MLADDSIGLNGIPLIDGHCHSIHEDFQECSETSFRRLFTEATDDRLIDQHVPHGLIYQGAIRDLAVFLACPPTLSAILDSRRQRPDYLAALCQDAGLLGLLVDSGYPLGTMSLSRLQVGAGCHVGAVLRLETLAEELLLTVADFHSFEVHFGDALQAAKQRGVVALKSIVAYRSGLAVQSVTADVAARTFEQIKALAAQQGRIRLTAKPLLDYCLGLALAEARDLQLPVQFHTGFGDPDIDIVTANPALLRPLITDPRYAGVSIVLLHMGYPYVREAAFLASLYPDVYVDISLVVPLLRPMLPHLLRELLALAPTSKILYGSDGHSQPELYWLGARYARWALGVVLRQLLADGIVAPQEAHQIAARICFRNALQLYRLESSWPGLGTAACSPTK
jgi:uncharacterized protein